MTNNKNTFTLYPAIDLLGGQCVRLLQGDYNQETVYGDPKEMALKWVEQGAEWLHIVDLDGAKDGGPKHEALITSLAADVPVPIQVGGGIRTMEQVERYLTGGVARVILGTAAIKDPEFVQEALRNYGGQIAIGLDVRDGYVATEGWLEASETRAEEVARRLVEAGAQHFIFTDISKDGTLAGPNVAATVQLAQAAGVSVIASGGVSRLDDIRALKAEAEQGISGAIIGKALYQGVFSLAEALAVVRGEA